MLVSSLILALSLLAALSLYGFSMSLVNRTGDEGYAYNIARRWLEESRSLGHSYLNLPDGTTTKYYDPKGGGESDSAFNGARFRMDRVVTSDKYTTVSGGGQHPSDSSMRTVVITVTYVSGGEEVERTGTILVRSGV